MSERVKHLMEKPEKKEAKANRPPTLSDVRRAVDTRLRSNEDRRLRIELGRYIRSQGSGYTLHQLHIMTTSALLEVALHFSLNKKKEQTTEEDIN